METDKSVCEGDLIAVDENRNFHTSVPGCIAIIKPQCRRCGGYNLYFDSHAGFAICPDCGWDTHRDEDYWYVMSEYMARKWQRGIINGRKDH